MKRNLEGVQKLWNKYKYAALIVLLGAALLLWPGSGEDVSPIQQQTATAVENQNMESRMEDILGSISGVGQVKVMLTVDTDGQRVLAQDTQLTYSGNPAAPEDYSRRSETVLSGGGSDSGAVVVQQVYPAYRGALVVCQGGNRADVRLAVTEAVAALTGLPTDRITVAQWQ